MEQQLLKQGYIARGGQIIDATLAPAPKQHFTRDDKKQLKGARNLPLSAQANFVMTMIAASYNFKRLV
ncbi:hypothetical protein NTGBS_130052 [Candidatus Nitrotoga sp. BS]|nr:hypothetical protein NTGBS_130052 [Candidatus Nitrotoga sp. BS]